MSGNKVTGFMKNGKMIKFKFAKPEASEISSPLEDTLNKKPSSSRKVREDMFTKAEVDDNKSTKPIIPTVGLKVQREEEGEGDKAVKAVKAVAVADAVKADKDGEGEAVAEKPVDESFDDTLKKLEDLIVQEETGNPYINEIPTAYVPETRRGFSDFIKGEYSDFMLKSIDEQESVAYGEKYPYQKFIREYMRQASPYRGVLVYHGLGSGKTCSAIAASEALFSTANKKIIVFTPASLLKNFLNEITFCGFKHYRLKNYWIALEKTPIHETFATEVLNISQAHLKKATHIWVPDFDQEPNYDSLSPDEQTEIRKQILSILIYDKNKNPTGRIRFINYNGITAKKLKEIACTDPTYFDDAVIIVDEIHNLIRLMTNKIEPYITTLPTKRRMAIEKITTDSWKPSLCSTAKTYNRGYSFYRFLIGAKNSKIIGLSGTPLINFPEELGILSNVLHGYIPCISGVLAIGGDKALKAIKATLLEYKYSDFVSVEPDTAGQGIRFLITLLPEGIRKVSNIGVERIPDGIVVPSREDILKEVKALFSPQYKFSTEPSLQAKPLLPITNEEFSEKFLHDSSPSIKNNIVLLKRLSGLISYYKGARQDLMPKIISDKIIRVPMSEYQQKMYTIQRSSEILKEQDTKTESKKGKSQVWSEVFMIEQTKTISSYRMGSRQVCNFAFPPQVTRPRPSNVSDEQYEAHDTKDIIDTLPEPVDEAFPELEEEEEVNSKSIEEENEEIPDLDEMKGGAKSKTVAELLEIKKNKATQSDCKAGQKKGESYKEAVARAKKCLVEFAEKDLRLDNPDGLRIISPKFASILHNIQNTPGSSLVYSQFLDMEGIGIFRLVLDANGYEPIEIIQTSEGYSFSEKTKTSFMKGSTQPRYITFSGGEADDIRRYALDVFNARFNKLPSSLSSVLLEAGFKNDDNMRGQICQVFCITSAGAEGISLKNVRAVHIMEPYWNDVRLKQVKGRAVRIGSHLDLPKEKQNVSIYTYVTVFSNEAQKAKSGPFKIDETISVKDGISRKDAIENDIPVEKGVEIYDLSTDEYILLISQRKKKILEELEKTMKSAAVDCELDYAENKDGTFRCLSLKGKVGDFLYHPDLNTDILESASQFDVTEKKEERKILTISLKGIRYATEAKGDKFLVYKPDNLEIPIGEMLSVENKPAKPLTMY